MTFKFHISANTIRLFFTKKGSFERTKYWQSMSTWSFLALAIASSIHLRPLVLTQSWNYLLYHGECRIYIIYTFVMRNKRLFSFVRSMSSIHSLTLWIGALLGKHISTPKYGMMIKSDLSIISKYTIRKQKPIYSFPYLLFYSFDIRNLLMWTVKDWWLNCIYGHISAMIYEQTYDQSMRTFSVMWYLLLCGI